MSGSTKAGFAAKRQSAWREGGREGAKTRKRESGDRGKTPKRVARRIARVGQSGDRGKTPKRVPRQFAWPCIAAFCAFGENETEGRTSSLIFFLTDFPIPAMDEVYRKRKCLTLCWVYGEGVREPAPVLGLAGRTEGVAEFFEKRVLVRP